MRERIAGKLPAASKNFNYKANCRGAASNGRRHSAPSTADARFRAAASERPDPDAEPMWLAFVLRVNSRPVPAVRERPLCGKQVPSSSDRVMIVPHAAPLVASRRQTDCDPVSETDCHPGA